MIINGYRRPILLLIHANKIVPTNPPAHTSAAINDFSSSVNFASNGVWAEDRNGNIGDTHPQAMPYVTAKKFAVIYNKKKYQKIQMVKDKVLIDY